MTPEGQIVAALLVFAVIVITTLGIIVKKVPVYIDTAMKNRFADDDAKRQQELNASSIAVEKAHTESEMNKNVLSVTKDLAAGVLSSVAELRKMNEMQATNGGQLTTLKSDIDSISKTLTEGSKPLLDIGTEVKRILAIVEDIQKSPHLTDDKAKRLDDAVAQIGTVTRQLSELVVALQETRDDLLRKKHDSKPIQPVIIDKNGETEA